MLNSKESLYSAEIFESAFGDTMEGVVDQDPGYDAGKIAADNPAFVGTLETDKPIESTLKEAAYKMKDTLNAPDSPSEWDGWVNSFAQGFIENYNPDKMVPLEAGESMVSDSLKKKATKIYDEGGIDRKSVV